MHSLFNERNLSASIPYAQIRGKKELPPGGENLWESWKVVKSRQRQYIDCDTNVGFEANKSMK